MTWFQSLNPLLVIMHDAAAARALAPAGATAGASTSPARKMAIGALIVALRLSAAGARSRSSPAAERASWLWLAALLRDLHARRAVHPADRLGLFARLAPPRLRRDHGRRLVPRDLHRQPAAGVVGALWSRLGHRSSFFCSPRLRRGRAPYPARSVDQEDPRGRTDKPTDLTIPDQDNAGPVKDLWRGVTMIDPRRILRTALMASAIASFRCWADRRWRRISAVRSADQDWSNRPAE